MMTLRAAQAAAKGRTQNREPRAGDLKYLGVSNEHYRTTNGSRVALKGKILPPDGDLADRTGSGTGANTENREPRAGKILDRSRAHRPHPECRFPLFNIIKVLLGTPESS